MLATSNKKYNMDIMETTTTILKSLSDENRLRIVLMLKIRPLCVCEVSEALPIADSTLSAHLKNLRFAGIIDKKKDGRWIEYFLVNNKVILNIIDVIEKNIQDKTIILKDRNIIQKITKEICSVKK